MTAPEDAPRVDPALLAIYTHAGRLQSLPFFANERVLVLRWLAAQIFTPGERYTEREVAVLLAPRCLTIDAATLRRALVDAGVLARTRDGRAYWVAD